MSPTLSRLSVRFPAFAALIIAALSAEKPKADGDIVEEIYDAKFKADAAAMTALAAERDTAKAALAKAETDHKAALAAKDTQLSELQGKVARFQKFEKDGTAIIDPGTDATGATSGDDAADGKRLWAADAKVRAFFHNDQGTFSDAIAVDGLAAVKAVVAKAG